jgi:pyruvate dehydrogenase E2 component (dihydrolipoamide acetyltransferase)
MAHYDFKLPDIGEGVTEGEIVAWHVKPGDVVAEDDPMVEVMTDKATVTIGAPKAGTVVALGGEVGDVIKVGSVLVQFDLSGGGAASVASGSGATADAAPSAVAAAKPSEGPAATAVGDIKDSLPGASFFASKGRGGNGATAHASSSGATAAAPTYFAEKPLATPATRRLARERGVDLRRVPPTGPNGRTTKADVENYLRGAAASGGGQGAAAERAQARGHAQVPEAHRGRDVGARVASTGTGRAPVAIAPPPTGSDAAAGPLEERKPFVGLRRKIAERMQTSKNTAAHFTFVEECDVGRLKALHARLRTTAEERGVKLTFLPFIVKAVVCALKRHPVLNSALDESTNELVYRRYYHIGIAAATDAGLMVPVVRNADRLSILDVAREIERLAAGARAGTLKSDELSGSTFTITSLGKQGGLFATPVLNFPEVGILGVHQIKQRPVVRDGQIAVGEIMLLSLSFDHRIVDGHVGAAFAYDIIGYLEDPDRLLLEMA